MDINTHDVNDNNNDIKINYSTDFICTYHLHDDDIQDDMYRIQLLQVFHLKEWNDDTVNHTTQLLYNKMKKHTEFISLLKLLPKTSNIGYLFNTGILDEEPLLFQLLFQFDFFHLTHKCISELLNNNEIKKETLEELKNNIILKINERNH